MNAFHHNTDPLIGRRIGQYLIEEVIGEGATARVYRARHALLATSFAIKLFSADINKKPIARHRFIREAEALSAILHPNVVRMVNFSVTDDGRPFLVMEWIEGESLHHAIGEAGTLPPFEVLTIATQIASGLAAVHEAGVVHRDLKPSNIMMNAGQAKIVDFGLVCGDPFAAITEIDVVLGTPHYMAPEMIDRSEPITERTDLYSFGAIMFEMLTGLPPFEGLNILQLLSAHVQRTPPKLAPVFDELGEIVDRMLEKDPRRRPISAMAVLDWFQSIAMTTETIPSDTADTIDL